MIIIKRFDDVEKRATLLNEVNRYVEVMHAKCQAGKVEEKTHVRPEIETKFWPNSRCCLNSNFNYEMANQVSCSLHKEDDELDSRINGLTDHVIRIEGSELSSFTLEDKQICVTLGDKEISQVVTEICSEVELLEKTISYVPIDYIGLLQNGPEWIGVIRTVSAGRITWRHVRAPPAFTVTEGIVSSINSDNCILIARLIEHTYCTADYISGHIRYPQTRPNIALQTIEEINDVSDCDDDSGEDEDDKHQREASRQKLAGNEIVAQGNFLKPNSSSKMVLLSDRSAAGRFSSFQNQDYFLLPLTRANVANHRVC